MENCKFNSSLIEPKVMLKLSAHPWFRTLGTLTEFWLVSSKLVESNKTNRPEGVILFIINGYVICIWIWIVPNRVFDKSTVLMHYSDTSYKFSSVSILFSPLECWIIFQFFLNFHNFCLQSIFVHFWLHSCFKSGFVLSVFLCNFNVVPSI